MRNAGLEEAQAGIKIAGRNINNLIYADDTTLMAECEEDIEMITQFFLNFVENLWVFYQHILGSQAEKLPWMITIHSFNSIY